MEALLAILYTAAVILIIFAAFGSTRPAWPFTATFAMFGLCLILFSGPKGPYMSVGAAYAIVFFVAFLMVCAFVGALIVSFALKQKVIRFSAKIRIALLCASLLLISVALFAPHKQEFMAAKIEKAIANNSPTDLAFWWNEDDFPADDAMALIVERYGLSEDSLQLLRALGSSISDVWPLIMAYPPSPERLDFLKKIVPLKPGYADADYFIQAMDAGDTETADVLFPVIWMPDVSMLKAARPDLLREVLSRGLPERPPYNRIEALEEAAQMDVEYTRILLEAGFDPNFDDRDHKYAMLNTTPLLAAVPGSWRNKGVVEALLAAGADPNLALSGDPTPLHQAVSGGSARHIDTLLKAGANINAQNGYNRGAPLHYAAIWGNSPEVKLLLERGADPAIKDALGMTPLALAAWRGDSETVALLLAAGAPVDEPGAGGFTPLFHAARLGLGPSLAAILETAPKLREALGKPNNDGKTAWDMALALEGNDVTDHMRTVAFLDLPRNTMGIARSMATPGVASWRNALERRAECVRLLLQAGADPTRALANGNTIFHALFNNDVLEWEASAYHFDIALKNINQRFDLDELGRDIIRSAYRETLAGLLAAGHPLPDIAANETYEDYCTQQAPDDFYVKTQKADCLAAITDTLE